MWQRKELKRRGKRQFLRNWAATVAVCFILAFTGAEFAGSADFIGQFDPSAMLPDDQVAIQAVSLSNWELLLEWLRIDPMDGTHPMWAAADQSLAPAFDTLTAPFSAFFALLERSRFAGWLDIALAALGIAGGLWFTIWVLSAVSVGARRFLLESRVRDNISIAAMFTPFQHGCWRNVAKGMFLRSLFLLLWACTIVGFPVKLYSYRMVPYILAENPQARPAETLRLSRQMMRGNKWRCFVLDLTFYLHWTFLPLLASTVLGTAIGLATGDVALCQSLAAAAAGLLSLLFVNGYRSATDAGLYAALRQAQLDAGTPLSALFVVPAFGETAPAGEKPRLPDADVRLPEDPVFHYAQRHKGILSGTAVSVISNQCKKQKRQITDKHKLHGGMINNRSRKNNCNGSKKTFLFLKLIPLQPDITQNPVCNLFQGRQDLKVICHFNKGQQVGQKIQWVIKAVVSEIVNILPAAKLHGKIRKKISRLVKSLSEIFRKYTVL